MARDNESSAEFLDRFKGIGTTRDADEYAPEFARHSARLSEFDLSGPELAQLPQTLIVGLLNDANGLSVPTRYCYTETLVKNLPAWETAALTRFESGDMSVSELVMARAAFTRLGILNSPQFMEAHDEAALKALQGDDLNASHLAALLVGYATCAQQPAEEFWSAFEKRSLALREQEDFSELRYRVLILRACAILHGCGASDSARRTAKIFYDTLPANGIKNPFFGDQIKRASLWFDWPFNVALESKSDQVSQLERQIKQMCVNAGQPYITRKIERSGNKIDLTFAGERSDTLLEVDGPTHFLYALNPETGACEIAGYNGETIFGSALTMKLTESDVLLRLPYPLAEMILARTPETQALFVQFILQAGRENPKGVYVLEHDGNRLIAAPMNYASAKTEKERVFSFFQELEERIRDRDFKSDALYEPFQLIAKNSFSADELNELLQCAGKTLLRHASSLSFRKTIARRFDVWERPLMELMQNNELAFAQLSGFISACASIGIVPSQDFMRLWHQNAIAELRASRVNEKELVSSLYGLAVLGILPSEEFMTAWQEEAQKFLESNSFTPGKICDVLYASAILHALYEEDEFRRIALAFHEQAPETGVEKSFDQEKIVSACQWFDLPCAYSVPERKSKNADKIDKLRVSFCAAGLTPDENSLNIEELGKPFDLAFTAAAQPFFIEHDASASSLFAAGFVSEDQYGWYNGHVLFRSALASKLLKDSLIFRLPYTISRDIFSADEKIQARFAFELQEAANDRDPGAYEIRLNPRSDGSLLHIQELIAANT